MSDKTVALAYLGPEPDAWVAETDVYVERGGPPVELPADVADALLEQAPDSWKKATKKAAHEAVEKAEQAEESE